MGQATDDNMVNANCMLDKGYTHTHTLRICTCNTYCFSTTRMVARTHLTVTSHVHCLSCFRF